MAAETPECPRERLRERLEAIRARSEKASSWRSMSRLLWRLVNRSGYVPVKTRLAPDDLAFLAEARDDLLTLAELGLRLLDLHQPRDGGGLSSDPHNPVRRCRCCMARWPCPTVRAIAESFPRGHAGPAGPAGSVDPAGPVDPVGYGGR